MNRWLALIPLLALAAGACGDDNSDPRVYSTDPAGLIAFASTLTDNEEIYVAQIGADGLPGDWTNISQNERADREPAISNDGQRIAYSSQTESGFNIVVGPLEGGEKLLLTDDPPLDGGPRWSPDDSLIAFYSFRDQQNQLLWVVGVDGGEPTFVLGERDPGGDCVGGFPGGWLDSEHILYRGSNGTIDALQTCSIAVDGSGLSVISSKDSVLDYYPALSPDGERIAFTKIEDNNAEVYMMDVDGSNVRRLTDDAATDEYPVWSPDGEWLAFHSNRAGNFDLYIMRPNGSDVRQLTFEESDEMSPAWSAGQ
jgi:TolB protein